ncbi:FtsH protease activity modulator HflK [Chitinilyticum aquatile]|uniref:FtsH protease activity modulator HflK n=1 Tax=Chitinilyticum aquatile TaxID=362520 RepID=UPI000406FCCF|nr:FtsH protease activity modulator HflK [Chitinilyticum aquatile]
MSNDPQRGGRKDGPPEIDEIFRSLSAKVNTLFGGGRNPVQPSGNGGFGSGSAGIVAAVVLALWAASGLYIVDERENAVVTQFGRYVDTVTSPGLHWHLPWPVQRSELVNMTEIRKVELGMKGADGNMMLTADQNVIEVQLSVQYTLNNARDYLFNNKLKEEDGSDLVNQVAESAIREVVGRSQVDAVLNEGRSKISDDTKDLMQKLLDRYKSGVTIARVNIGDVQAPKEVQEAFSDAVKARQDLNRLINEGRAYYNEVVPRASGTAAKLLQEAEGYKQQVVSRAEGEADRFNRIAAEYAKAPQVTRDRMYYDTMQQVLKGSTKVLIDQKAGGNLLYLPLDKLIQASDGGAPASVSEAKAAETPAIKPSAESPRAAAPLRNAEREGR